MKPKYVIIYCEAFGYDHEDETFFVPSEVGEAKSVDVHHIATREDRIENLMALTRREHQDYGEEQYLTATLLRIHRKRLEKAGIPFDSKWFNRWIRRYENEEQKIK